MRIVHDKISNKELSDMAAKMFGNMVKAVVDVEQEIMAVDAEFHVELQAFLLKQGAQQQNLWGIKIYPDNVAEENWIEFSSMINIRPLVGNKSRGVDDPKVRDQIIGIVHKLVTT